MRTQTFTAHPESTVRHLPRLALWAAMATTLLAGCNSNSNATNPADGTTAANPSDPNAQDPTLANMAPVQQVGTPVNSTAQGPTQVAGYQQQAQPTQQSYTSPAPVERRAPSSSNQSSQYADQGSSGPNYYSGQDANNDDYDAETGYSATLSDISSPQPPPPLPVYEQPEAPDPNYLWTPGYWSYTPQGYYWVPGAWAQPPYTGALWTPGYWGGYNNGYRFHRGFWAAHIGFYGGINYGFGYFGSGYQGGYWNGDNFYYNRECNRVNDRVIHNVYQRNVVINNVVVNNTTINNRTINNVSYNGGRGGVQVQPRPAELAVLRERRVAPMQAQIQHQQQAAQNRQQFFAQNQGRPSIVAAVQPLRADRGIIAPAHTTAQINRALPVTQQIRQEQQFLRPANSNTAARPMPNQPVPSRIDANHPNQPQPNRITPNQTQNRPQPVQQTMHQNHTEPINQPNRQVQPNSGAQPARPGQLQSRPNQPENRPSQPQQVARPVAPQQQVRPTAPQPQPTRPAYQPQQPRPVTQPVRPQPETRPQPQTSHPQPVRPQPQQAARPQPQPQPQMRTQPQVQQSRPQAQPQQQQRPQQQQAHPQAHPEPHAAH